MKNAIKGLWLLLLVALPLGILLTGWARGAIIVQYGVSLYATLGIAAAIAVAFTLYSAKNWRGEDFGEKHHKWLLEKYAKELQLTSFQKYFHVLRAAPSIVLLLALGLPISATLVALVSVAFLITDGAISNYYATYGARATTYGRTRSDNP